MMIDTSKVVLGGILMAACSQVYAVDKIVSNNTVKPMSQLSHAVQASKPSRITSTPISASCPLNSGGPSLFGSKWRLDRIYTTATPKELDISMLVTNTALVGFGGCNKYAASFRRVGLTGFKVVNIQKTKKGCVVKRRYAAGPTINVGDWEGQYLKTVRRMGSVQREGDVLRFYDQNGKIAMVFSPTK